MKEEPSLEAHKHALVLKLAEGRKRLQDIEDQILRLLTDARGCLLDDLELIRVLQVPPKPVHILCICPWCCTVVSQHLSKENGCR